MGLLKAGGPGLAPPAAPAPAPVGPASLADPDPALRREAVHALVGAPDAVDRLVEVLAGETDHSVRQAAFIALAATGSRAAAEAAAALLADPDPVLRGGALEALAAMPVHAAALLEPLGRAADPDIRSFAVLLAADLPVAAGGAWLLALAERENDANVCAHLAEALGGSAADGAPAALAALAHRFPADAHLQFAVEIALRRLGAA